MFSFAALVTAFGALAIQSGQEPTQFIEYAQLLPTSTAVATKALFCAYGGVGMTPLSQSARRPYFAVAVVEIDSHETIAAAAISDFALFDSSGVRTSFTRVVSVEEFTAQRNPNEGLFAYYLKPGGLAWKGTLPSGTIQLRVRVALERRPNSPIRFRLAVGPYTVEGPINGRWPTG